MRSLLRWIVVLLLLGIVVFLLINFFNKSKETAKKVDNTKEPVIYEKADINPPVVVHEEPVIEEKTVEVGDTADFATISVYIGVFTIAAGVFYLRKRKASI